MPVVFVPGRGNVEFPDNMTLPQIKAAIQRDLGSRPKELSAIDEDIKRRKERLERNRARLSQEPTGISGVVEDVLNFLGSKSGRQESLSRLEEQTAAEIAKLENRAAYIQRTGEAPRELTPVEKYVEIAGKAPARAVVRGLSDIAGQLGGAGRTGEEVAKSVSGLGDRAISALGLTPNELAQYDPSLARPTQVGEAVGSTIPLVLAQLAGRARIPLQIALASGMGGAQQRREIEAQEARTGQKVGDFERAAAQAGGSLVNLAELAPIPGFSAIRPGRFLQRVARSVVEEGGQEAGTQAAQNIVEKLTYNPEQEISEGALESALIGGGVGGAFRGSVEAAGRILGEPMGIKPEADIQVDENGVPVPRETALRTVDITIPSREDPSVPINKRIEVLSEPDEEGFIRVRDEGVEKDMLATDLDDLEMASPAYQVEPETEAEVTPEPESTAGLASRIATEEEVTESPSPDVAPQEEVVSEEEANPKPVLEGAPIETPQGKVSRVRRLANSIRLSPAYINFVDQMSGASAADITLAKAYGVESLPENTSLKGKFETYLSAKNGKLKNFNKQFVEPLFDYYAEAAKQKSMTKEEVNDFLQSRAARDRNAKIAKRNKAMPDGGSGITDAVADAMQAQARTSGKIKELQQIAKMHDNIRDYALQALVDGDVISPETRDQWKAEEKDYTPYKGWAVGGDLAVEGQEDPHADYGSPIYTRQIGARGAPIKKAGGRESLASDSLTNMIADAQQQIDLAERNKVTLDLKKKYDENPGAFEGLFKVYTESNPKIVNGRAVPITDPFAYKNSIRGFEKGKPFFIDVAPNEHGAALKSAFENMDPKQYDRFSQWLMNASGFFRQLNTRFSPYFWPIEFYRGMADARGTVLSERGIKESPAYEPNRLKAYASWANTGINHYRPSVWDGVFSYIADREPRTSEGADIKALTAEMVQNGGEAGFEFAERAEAVAKRIQDMMDKIKAEGLEKGTIETKAGMVKAMKLVDGINEFVDLLPRVGGYKALIDAGVDAQDAARIALKTTLDNTKRGRYGRALDSIFWFTTPSITNLTKKVRATTSKYGRELMIANMAMGFATTLLNMANAPDSDDDGEDDFSQLPEWKKLAFTHIYYSKDADPIPLPNGFFFAFEKYLGVKMAEVVAGKLTDAEAGADVAKAASEVGSAFFSGLVPIIKSSDDRVIIPSLLAPMYDLAVNENFFNSPIYNEPFDKSVARASVSKPTTPEAYKKIAQTLQEVDFGPIQPGFGDIKGDIDISPDQIKYFVDQYSGGIGRVARDIADPEKSAIAKMNPFNFDEALIDTAPMTRFYERADAIKGAARAAKKNEDGDSTSLDWLSNTNPVAADQAVIDAYNDADKELTELRQTSEDMSPEEYKAERARIMSDFNRVYNDTARSYGVGR